LNTENGKKKIPFNPVKQVSIQIEKE